MKRNLITGLILAMCSLAMTSCQKNEDDAAKKVFMSFSATVDQPASKTTLNGADIYWSEGDKISVLSSPDANDELNISDINGRFATFSGEVHSSTNGYIALYPYNELASYTTTSSTILTQLPSIQTAVAGSFDPKANLMTAYSTGTEQENSFAFKNVCAYLKVTAPCNCASIQIISEGNRKISGYFNITVDATGTPTSIAPITNTSQKASSKYIRLNGPIQQGQDYYIAVLPGTLDGGFSIKFWGADNLDANGYYQTTLTSSVTLDRGVIYPLAGFNTTNYVVRTVPTNAVDLGLPSYKLWASSNIEVSSSSSDNFAANAYALGSFFQFGKTTAYSPDDICPASANGPIDEIVGYWCGTEWELPSDADFLELSNNCIVTSTSNNGVDGIQFSSASQNMFLPKAGCFTRAVVGGLIGDTQQNRYWTSDYTTPTTPHTLMISGSNMAIANHNRYQACPIRPVVKD